MKRDICMMLSVLLACIFLAGCTIEAEEAQKDEETGYEIYYLSADETKLKKEMYFPEEDSETFMVKDLMQRLGNKSGEGEEINLLPKEVSINSYDLRDGLLVIDFNSQYNKISRAREVLARAGIVKMFLQLPGIQTVRFTVAGKELLDSKNEKIGDMNADTFIEYSGQDADAYRYDTFTLYFTDKSGERLIEEKRNVYYKRNLPKEWVVLEQLAKGPMAKGNYPAIPGNTQALSVTTADRVCYVNMEQSFRENALNVTEEVQIYSVVNSLLAACEADKVQISIEGSTDGTLAGDLPLYNFYEKNENLVLREMENRES